MNADERRLRREVGFGGAILLGLGSIVGTGVFVSIGVAAGIAGGSVVLAAVLAAAVATFNGLNSAQLAASHPVSGGTYEYGYRYLNPALGFTAGWMFLLAKSASAATAALGFAGYVLNLFGAAEAGLVPLALGAVFAVTALVLSGIRRSNLTNTVIVSVTLLALAWFVIGGWPEVQTARFRPFLGGGNLSGLLEATALMFVAYTGYGRIATLGEEVRDPARTIPRAVVVTLAVTMVLYAAVAFVGVGASGADALAGATETTAAPLEVVARGFGAPGVATAVTVGAVTAMLGVLLNLLLGLSRVLLAMGRRHDMPAAVSRLSATATTPTVAVVVMGVVVGLLVLVGNVRTTWTFSAFTVLVYYAITNLAALRIPEDLRRFPRWVAGSGLAGCLFLTFWIEPLVWVAGVLLIAAGLVWHRIARRRAG